MRAVQIRRTGGPDVLELTELPVPEPRSGEVLLKVEAAGVNFADIMVVAGTYLTPTQTPLVPGLEVAGRVVALGPDVQGVAVGRRVAALVGRGGFAEFVRAPAASLVPVPEAWSAKEAAAFPVSFFTAYGALKALGRAQAGERVLVQAAGGALGTATVQLAKALGLEVIGAASSDQKLELARRLGADHTVLAERDAPFERVLAGVREATGGRGVDLICEITGGEDFERNLELLAPYGRILVIGAASGRMPTLNPLRLMYKNQAVIGVWLSELAKDAAVMGEASAFLGDLLAAGRVKPVVGRTFPLEAAADAFRWIQSRHNQGKVLLKP
ncbi:Alcohol dehydrogenase zinc-binding domain protein [Truepera radiovictrix DSM 17093]|uniref:Alcohol dehydrogenase zinc-binding domain protein n=2 Tax=Truepera TaxID=332248 RepID=D7CV38_TRURR|nr:Alcohol dehydrogenase zinc-binding domain protein [Truepera radiovictrix DSM 17093]